MSTTAARVGDGALIAWVCGAEVLSMLAFSAFAALLPVLATELGLSNTEAGLIGGVLLGGYMCAVPVLGPLTDRVDPRRVYAGAALVIALGATTFALAARGFWTAMAAQVLIGIGLAGTYVPGMKALSERLQGRAQSRAAAFYGSTFGVGSAVSIAFAGFVAAAWGWRSAFALAAIGPVLAAVVMLGVLRPSPPRKAAPAALLAFRPVLANRAVRPYLYASAAHAWELYATRAWIVAFLAYAESTREPGDGVPGGVTLVAALITLLGPVASVSGNELAHRFGRARMIVLSSFASAGLGLAIGFAAAWPWPVLLALAGLHMMLMLLDGSVITAGMVAAAEPAHRGSTIAVYSFMGFGAGFVSPALFGVVLDLAGGRGVALAWALAFASLAPVSLLAVRAARGIRETAGAGHPRH